VVLAFGIIHSLKLPGPNVAGKGTLQMAYRNNDDDINVEGTVAEQMGIMPWNHPHAIRDIQRFYNEQVEVYLQNRADRIARDDREQEEANAREEGE
jgi:hypothetical protein